MRTSSGVAALQMRLNPPTYTTYHLMLRKPMLQASIVHYCGPQHRLPEFGLGSNVTNGHTCQTVDVTRLSCSLSWFIIPSSRSSLSASFFMACSIRFTLAAIARALQFFLPAIVLALAATSLVACVRDIRIRAHTSMFSSFGAVISFTSVYTRWYTKFGHSFDGLP